MPRLAACCLFVFLPLVAGCGDPPVKELNQAQGAIDAARAAGADSYATEDYAAAVDALKRAEEAVAQRDYRLALSQALESRERAQTAAKLAANQKAAVRSQAERLLAEVTSAVSVASARLAADGTRVPKPLAANLTAAIANARAALDDAGKALAIEDYLEARRRLQGVRETLRKALQALPPPTTGRPTRRGR
jgi:Domain of unknown function (DUF4398)